LTAFESCESGISTPSRKARISDLVANARESYTRKERENQVGRGEGEGRRGKESVLVRDRILIYRSFDGGGVLRLKGNELLLDDTMILKTPTRSSVEPGTEGKEKVECFCVRILSNSMICKKGLTVVAIMNKLIKVELMYLSGSERSPRT